MKNEMHSCEKPKQYFCFHAIAFSLLFLFFGGNIILLYLINVGLLIFQTIQQYKWLHINFIWNIPIGIANIYKY
jgi:hypothetical protein